MIPYRDISRVTFSLSLLIQSNNKRVSYYKSVAVKTQDNDLKSLCMAYADQSQNFVDDLTRWVKAYGSTPAPARKTSLATQAWERMKELLTDEQAAMTSGAIERDTLKVYKTALSLSFIPSTVANDIRKHVRDLERARDLFEVLRTEAQVMRVETKMLRQEVTEEMVAA
jgi:uncharacterized protein (TIGR02284 family)